MFKGKRILVTGSSGFVGTSLVKELVHHGAVVIPYDILGGLDVLNIQALNFICASKGIEIIYHLAAQSQVLVAEDYPYSAIHTNITGTLNVLEVARGSDTIERVIVASSDKVYGEATFPCTEGTVMLAKSPYDVGKMCADKLCHLYWEHYGVNVIISRSCNIYGSGDTNYTRLIPSTIRRLRDGVAPIIHGDGTQVRAWVHVDDVVQGYLLLASVPPGAYNFGGDEMNVNSIVELLRGYMGGKPPVHVGHGEGEIYRQYVNDSKVREYGWKRYTFIEQGLMNMCNKEN